MKIKKIISITLVGVMAAALLAGCKKAQSAPASEPVVEETAAPVEEQGEGGGEMLGGWVPYPTIMTPVVTEDAQTAFDKAMESYDGPDMQAAALLATQVVSGTNYAYAALADTTWYYVVVYADLQGNASVTSATEINPGDLKTQDNIPESGLLGGWKMAPVSNAVVLTEEVNNAFNQATQAYVGVGFRPLALIGTQMVSGMNYLILCQGTTVTAEPQEALYFVTIYVDTQGNASVYNVAPVDMAAYTGH